MCHVAYSGSSFAIFELCHNRHLQLIVEPWGTKSTSRTPFLSQKLTFQVEVVCLNLVFVGNEVCLHSMDCCFDLGLCATPMSHPLWLYGLRNFRIPHCIVSESPMYWPAVSKHLQHTVCTQFPKLEFIRHNFVTQWQWNLRKMLGKWRILHIHCIINKYTVQKCVYTVYTCTFHIYIYTYIHHTVLWGPPIV